MTTRKWFSAKLRRMCLLEDDGCDLANDSIHIFQASDFDEAFERALEIGRRHEEEYKNEDGKLVRWRFAAILTLDIIDEPLDGAEVYSLFEEFDPPRDIGVDASFHPEKSEPDQTL